jgi:hypothetical protein
LSKKWLEHIPGDLLTNSSGHPGCSSFSWTSAAVTLVKRPPFEVNKVPLNTQEAAVAISRLLKLKNAAQLVNHDIG